MEPAIETIIAVQDTGRTSGLNRAVRHLATEAQRVAHVYAEMGADYAGELFNRVMGNQASDGAYFTRPEAASLLSMLALDAALPPDTNYTDQSVWRNCRVVDLACGSGTLLSAALTEMKRRAEEQGASDQELSHLQKIAVEESFAGLDINPVSLQLAAAQLTSGNTDVAYRNMNLHLMPYGPQPDNAHDIRVGTLELLGQSRIVSRRQELALGDQSLDSRQVRMRANDPTLEDAVNAAVNARIVIMNPPFTNRSKMGEKYSKDVQRALRSRVDMFEEILVRADAELSEFMDKNSIGPMFEAIAEKCADSDHGVVAMVRPTIVLTGPAALQMRKVFAKRFHIHTLLTCHQPNNINMSQNTNINESLIIAKRYDRSQKDAPPTRIIALDRLPSDASEAQQLNSCLCKQKMGLLPDGWGEVSEWPADRIASGDWSAGVFRSPELASACNRLREHPALIAACTPPPHAERCAERRWADDAIQTRCGSQGNWSIPGLLF